jgi:large exoprotein involved in heme utilization and adhesion
MLIGLLPCFTTKDCESSNDITALSQGNPFLNGDVTFANSAKPQPVNLPDNFLDRNPKPDERCAVENRDSSFVITGRGGLAEAPDDTLMPMSILTDWVSLPPTSTPSTDIPRSQPRPTEELVEAQAIVQDKNGTVHLVANAGTVIPASPWLHQPHCHTKSVLPFKINH